MITLASDFGSPYPAAMRGVVCRRSDARVVDVAHDLPRGDTTAAAFWLRFVLPEFPPAVHCAVVDPGVGTDRGVLVVRAGEHVLVGPDNGSLLPPARALAGTDDDAGGAETVAVYAADPGDPASNTFHGRDVFAPLAADVHGAVAGVREGDWDPGAVADLDDLSPAGDYVAGDLPGATVTADRVEAAVLAVDGFGNVVTSAPGDAVDGWAAARVGNVRAPVVATFGAVPAGDPLVTVGSHGNVELDVNDGRGDEAFGLSAGGSVVLRRTE
jgi:S-adenosylmethionine hydrolase